MGWRGRYVFWAIVPVVLSVGLYVALLLFEVIMNDKILLYKKSSRRNKEVLREEIEEEQQELEMERIEKTQIAELRKSRLLKKMKKEAKKNAKKKGASGVENSATSKGNSKFFQSEMVEQPSNSPNKPPQEALEPIVEESEVMHNIQIHKSSEGVSLPKFIPQESISRKEIGSVTSLEESRDPQLAEENAEEPYPYQLVLISFCFHVMSLTISLHPSRENSNHSAFTPVVSWLHAAVFLVYWFGFYKNIELLKTWIPVVLAVLNLGLIFYGLI